MGTIMSSPNNAHDSGVSGGTETITMALEDIIQFAQDIYWKKVCENTESRTTTSILTSFSFTELKKEIATVALLNLLLSIYLPMM